MSNTPETDAEEASCNGDPSPVYEFARRLERDRNAEVARSARLVADLHESNRIICADAAQITLVSAERDALRAQVAVLREALEKVYNKGNGREVFAPCPEEGWSGHTFLAVQAALNSTAETK